MSKFSPNYMNIVNAAYNRPSDRIPLYEHLINIPFMEKVIKENFSRLYTGNKSEKEDFFKYYNGFYKNMGYDTVSFEQCIGPVMPGSGALGQHKPGVIKTREDFFDYPWDDIPDMYCEKCFPYFECMEKMMPEGMKGIGGVGNGIFECVQDITGYMNLCYIKADDIKLYEMLFEKTGEISLKIWKRFLDRFSDGFAVMRFGDDLGYKNNTLLSKQDIKNYIIPQYKKIVDLIHKYDRPFLLHSCGNIISVMDDLINTAGIDAKHSNEDNIAPYSFWVDTYGKDIGNFGGIDTDNLYSKTKDEIKEITLNVIKTNKGGFAVGSGNSIPEYIPTEGYLTMVNTVREYRGDFS